MDAATALHAAAAVLLIIAGAAKIARPATTADLLSDLGAPQFRAPIQTAAVVALGTVEAIVGVASLAVGGAAWAAITGGLYALFAVSVVRALAVGAPSCGCFGRVEVPPSWIHVGGNIMFATASFVAVAGPTPIEIMESQPAAGLGFVVVVGVLAGLALLLFTALPEAMAARGLRHGPGRSERAGKSS